MNRCEGQRFLSIDWWLVLDWKPPSRSNRLLPARIVINLGPRRRDRFIIFSGGYEFTIIPNPDVACVFVLQVAYHGIAEARNPALGCDV